MVAESILHKVNLYIWVARIFIKYLWQSLGQSGCFGENIKFSNVTLKGNPCCLEDELRKIEKSLAFNICTHVHMSKKHCLFRFSKKSNNETTLATLWNSAGWNLAWAVYGICRYWLKCKCVTVGTGGPLLWWVEGVPYNTMKISFNIIE